MTREGVAATGRKGIVLTICRICGQPSLDCKCPALSSPAPVLRDASLRPWKVHARSGATVKVVSFASREKRDEAVPWYERLGYDAVTTSGPKESA